MKVFISAGEASGDIHGGNLIRALKSHDPNVECVGFGGERMADAGAELLYPLTQHAVMWFTRVFASLGTFLKLLSQADRYFAQHRPDAVVLIDYPGFHWWLARRAHYHGIPVVYFVPPQLWAWAGWRVQKMKRFVDHVLCSLPFEPSWYAERGVQSQYVGHPFFDEIPRQKLDSAFLAQHRKNPAPVIAILPGSRGQEIEHNWESQFRAAQAIYEAHPEVRFMIACHQSSHQERIDRYLMRYPGLPIETHVRKTPEIIELAHSCIAVSGSVSLELLYREKPTVILYRVAPWFKKVADRMRTSKYITLVNLLADRELFPEFPCSECPASSIRDWIVRWLDDPFAHDVRKRDLRRLKAEVGQPGACDKVAQLLLNLRNGTIRLSYAA